MKMVLTQATTPDEYIAALAGWQRDACTALRAAVREAAPALEERLKWGHLVYFRHGPALMIRAEPKRVLFGFWRGKLLRDIEPRLKPGGKYEMATLQLVPGTPLDRDTVLRLVKRANELHVPGLPAAASTATLKTQATGANVQAFLAAIADPMRRADCDALVHLMSSVTGEAATMWGPSIVGFGRYRYAYDSGREGEMCVTGFSPRKGDLSIYLDCESPAAKAKLAALGRHKAGKSCLYVRRLADVDMDVLRELVTSSVAGLRARHP